MRQGGRSTVLPHPATLQVDAKAVRTPLRRRADQDPGSPARNVQVISLTAAFTSTWFMTWSPVLPLLLGSRGASRAAIAATFALLNVGTAFAQYFGGRLTDRVGMRRVIGWTGVALGCTWLGMTLMSGSWLALAGLYVLGNTLFGLQSTAFVTIVSESVAPDRRTRAFSYYQFWSAVSMVAGPLAGGLLLLPRLSPPFYLGATGLAYLGIGVTRLLALREPRALTKAPRPALTLRRVAEAAAGTSERRELLVLTVGVTLAFALTVNGPFMPLVAHAVDGLRTSSVDILFGIGPLGAIAVSAVAGRLRRHGAALGAGLALLAAAIAVMDLPMPVAPLVAVFLLGFAGYQVATVAYLARRVHLAGAESIGEVLGASSAVAGIAAFLGLLVAGVLGSRGGMLSGAAVALLTAAWQWGGGRPRFTGSLQGRLRLRRRPS